MHRILVAQFSQLLQLYIGNPFSKLGKERKEILQNELKLFWKEHSCFRALLFPRDISTFSDCNTKENTTFHFP